MIAAKGVKKKPVKAESAEAYAKRLAWNAEANRKATAAHRDFGRIPRVGDRRRKSACRKSLRKFCEVYLPLTFDRPWGPDHLEVIRIMELAVRKGGLFALAMPRGSGKTSLTEAAALWAILYGFRRFVFLIGATEPHAIDLLDSIKSEIESNDLLLEDFPEICLPVRRLEGVTTRRLLSNGGRVRITWTTKEIVLPWIEGRRPSPGSGARLRVRGITGAIRGAKAKLPSGEVLRPDFVIPDDPQTDESAISPSQVQHREKIVTGAILGLAGPGKKIAGVMPCTVIADGDLSDRLLSHEIHPEWGGLRIPFVKTFPDNMDMWNAYAEVRADSLRETRTIRKATNFYKANRVEMDRGSSVSWESRFESDEVSAIQHAMNKMFSDKSSFWAEMQNDPRESSDEEVRIQSAKELSARTNGSSRYDAMSGSQFVTGFIDVHKKLLYYGLVAWRSDFTGSVIDYGTFPDQGRKYYSMNDSGRTLSKKYKGHGVEASVFSGLTDCVAMLNARSYRREDDLAEMIPNLIMIDANWQTSTVRDFCRKMRSTQVVPSHGRYVGASSKPITEYRKAKGERVGLQWKTSLIERIGHVLFDTNFWKSFIHERLGIAFGDHGSLTFYGDNASEHRLISEHLVAEYRSRVKNISTGRELDEWKLKASKPDNHFLDMLVGCAVGASIMGIELDVGGDVKPVRKPTRRKRRRVRYF